MDKKRLEKLGQIAKNMGLKVKIRTEEAGEEAL